MESFKSSTINSDAYFADLPLSFAPVSIGETRDTGTPNKARIRSAQPASE